MAKIGRVRRPRFTRKHKKIGKRVAGGSRCGRVGVGGGVGGKKSNKSNRTAKKRMGGWIEDKTQFTGFSGINMIYDNDTTKPRYDKECAICLVEFNRGDEITELKCNHLFHTVCITRWITTPQINGKNKNCPICITNLEPIKLKPVGTPRTTLTRITDPIYYFLFMYKNGKPYYYNSQNYDEFMKSQKGLPYAKTENPFGYIQTKDPKQQWGFKLLDIRNETVNEINKTIGRNDYEILHNAKSDIVDTLMKTEFDFTPTYQYANYSQYKEFVFIKMYPPIEPSLLNIKYNIPSLEGYQFEIVPILYDLLQ